MAPLIDLILEDVGATCPGKRRGGRAQAEASAPLLRGDLLLMGPMWPSRTRKARKPQRRSRWTSKDLEEKLPRSKPMLPTLSPSSAPSITWSAVSGASTFWITTLTSLMPAAHHSKRLLWKLLIRRSS